MDDELRLLMKKRDHGLNYGMDKKVFDESHKIIEHIPDCERSSQEQGTVPAHYKWPWYYAVCLALFLAALALLAGCTNRYDMPKWHGYQLIFEEPK